MCKSIGSHGINHSHGCPLTDKSTSAAPSSTPHSQLSTLHSIPCPSLLHLPSLDFYSSTFPLLHPFLFPFQSFIPNPPLFLSYIFRSTPIFFCSLSLSFPAFSSLKSLVPLKFTIFFLSTSSISHSFGLFSAKTFHSILACRCRLVSQFPFYSAFIQLLHSFHSNNNQPSLQ